MEKAPYCGNFGSAGIRQHLCNESQFERRYRWNDIGSGQEDQWNDASCEWFDEIGLIWIRSSITGSVSIPKLYFLVLKNVTRWKDQEGFLGSKIKNKRCSTIAINEMENEIHLISCFQIPGDFENWSPMTQGVVLSSFFYGYIISQLPGGYLAYTHGAKTIFFAGTFGKPRWLNPSAPFPHLINS